MKVIRYSFAEKIKNLLSESVGYYNFMSYSRRKSCDEITDISDALATHVVKVLILDRSRDLDHWCDEIINFVGKIGRYATNVKTKKGRLNRRLLLHMIYEEPIGCINGLKSLIKSIRWLGKYKVPSDINIPYQALLDEVIKFYNFVVDEYIYSNDPDINSGKLRKYIKSMPELCR